MSVMNDSGRQIRIQEFWPPTRQWSFSYNLEHNFTHSWTKITCNLRRNVLSVEIFSSCKIMALEFSSLRRALVEIPLLVVQQMMFSWMDCRSLMKPSCMCTFLDEFSMKAFLRILNKIPLKGFFISLSQSHFIVLPIMSLTQLLFIYYGSSF